MALNFLLFSPNSKILMEFGGIGMNKRARHSGIHL
jgi:hypothetical protein